MNKKKKLKMCFRFFNLVLFGVHAERSGLRNKETMEMKKKKSGIVTVCVVVGAVALGLAGASAWASDCKGLDQASCETKPECSWNKGYARSDGVQVKAHCRAGKKSGKDTQKESKE
jgi:flagellar basal body-associated protein FliL